MPFLLGLANSISQSLCAVSYRRALRERMNMSNSVFALVPCIFLLITTIIAHLLGLIEWHLLSPLILTCIGISSLVGIWTNYLGQHLNKEEKLSVLGAWGQLSAAGILILNYLVYRDTPVSILAVALGVVAFLFVTSFDWRERHFSKNTPLIVLREMSFIVIGFAAVTAIHTINPWTYSCLCGLVSFAGFSLSAFVQKRSVALELRAQSRLYWWLALFSFGFWLMNKVIERTLVHQMGLTFTTILGFLTLITSVLIAWLWMGERPSLKSLIIAIVAMSAVGSALYLK